MGRWACSCATRSDGPQPQVSKATSGGSHLGVMSTGTIGQQPGLSRRENTSQSEQGLWDALKLEQHLGTC
eukprot:1018049-Amphidinium_carterae.1